MLISSIVVPMVFTSPARHTRPTLVPIKNIPILVCPSLAVRVAVSSITLPIAR